MQALRVGEGVGDTEPSPLVPLSFHAALGPPSSAPPQMREGALAHFDLACAIRMGRGWPCVELDARWTCASELGDAAVERVDTTTPEEGSGQEGVLCSPATPERGADLGAGQIG